MLGLYEVVFQKLIVFPIVVSFFLFYFVFSIQHFPNSFSAVPPLCMNTSGCWCFVFLIFLLCFFLFCFWFEVYYTGSCRSIDSIISVSCNYRSVDFARYFGVVLVSKNQRLLELLCTH